MVIHAHSKYHNFLLIVDNGNDMESCHVKHCSVTLQNLLRRLWGEGNNDKP